MKNITKSLLIGGLVLPCAIGLAACGPTGPLSETAQCNTTGTYVESTLDDYNSTATTAQGPLGYRLTMDMNMTDSENNRMNMRTNAIYVDGEIMANVSMPGVNMNTYITGGYIYMDVTAGRVNAKMKTPMQSLDIDDTLNLYGGLNDFQALLDMIPEDNSLVNVSKITDENETRYKLELNSVAGDQAFAYSNVVIYLNFVDGNIQEAKMTTSFTAVIEGEQASAEMSITMSAYSEELEFPDFSRYMEMQM